MTIDRDYIKNNGLLELYLLGELSETESNQVEAVLNSDDSLRKEFNQLEEDFERLALENAITPKAGLKESLLSSIDSAKKETPIIPLKSNDNKRSFQYIAAAVIGFLMISSGFLYIQWKSANNELLALKESNSDLNNKIESLENNIAATTSWYASINQPEVDKYTMKGNSTSPSSVAVAYVNNDTKSVILNTKGLAKLEEDKTYQLWADVEGVMIDMGVIPNDQDMVAMTYIENAESLNITIENAGGNDHPTVEQLITNVYL